ncbi:P-loop containing nucleoside triphosphate hydrolase protein [Fomitiporia mediterranea MF3/22]|uniref:P-loop containing nucleoside triphosphate hydrolase protein n=1 Tax=Fomitiporia mediterranea (strain MF3/22) TaxID=694068 RepID=UPI0004407792|nr:P-loop containing nucleoside triphosphate hydrolase protein [Fomitiporia mediterranea MF3/22]EJD04641.1 P-loop containing nucleoside triphosphate hydrolase protein [Fomitiporia mediterranea MF3/22]
MSARLLHALTNASLRSPQQSLQSVLGFHSSSFAAAAPKSRGGPVKSSSRGRKSPKGLPRKQFKSTSRTRLVKSLKPTNSSGKYEVAKAEVKWAEVQDNQAAEQKSSIDELLDKEFDRSSTGTDERLPDSFSSPPLLPALAQSVVDVLGQDAKPTPIQALALKHLFSLSQQSERCKEFLLASETGSGKSFAYLLPLLQYLKETEDSVVNPPSRLPINPRAIVIAPTHELTRQLSVFAKSLVHHAKLRILCASRANAPNTHSDRSRSAGSARQMKHVIESLGQDSEVEGGELHVHPQMVGNSRPIDVLVSTPVKALEMVRGWGWDKVGTPESEREGRKFRAGKPEMGLKRVECVVVDEADVLFDPDFRDTTLNLLSDISKARGHPIPTDSQQQPQPIIYPFHLILTSATIPSSLSTYLTTHHPSLTRLASPHLHRLPSTLHTEHIGWTGGNRFADIERRLRRVWAEDALRGPDASTGRITRSRVLIFCNRSTSVDALGSHLTEHGIPNVTLTSTGIARLRGSNRHLSGFLKGSTTTNTSKDGNINDMEQDKNSPYVLITTSLLSRGLDFSPSVKHVFIVDSPRNMIDFLHRAGRSGRAGQRGKVVVFGKLKGRGSGVDMAMKGKVKALARK